MEDYNKAVIDLWAVADEFRGINPDDIMIYIFGFIFFGFLSGKLENFVNKEFKTSEFESTDLDDNEFDKKIEASSIRELGYYVNPEYCFHEVTIQAKNGGYVINNLKRAFEEIEKSSMGQVSENAFKNIFEDIDLDSKNLGKNDIDRNFTISRILIHLSKINFNEDTGIYGDILEYLISKYSSNLSKKGPTFYTPQQVSELIAKLVCVNKNNVNSVYDPASGSASLILEVAKECDVDKLYGQEINRTIFNLARMNMIIHKVKYEDFDIAFGDTLVNPQHIDRKFDIIVSKPPFSMKWSPSEDLLRDERFKDYKRLAPSSKADYAFIQHMIYHLTEDGVMAVVMPHGVLFRGGTEGIIRKHIINEKNYLDAVIGLPANIYYETAIPSAILIFKKSRKVDDNIIFIDASKGFERGRPYHKLRDEDIKRIVETYNNREDVDKFSYTASLTEIRENNYNLNIPRYVDTFEEEQLNRDELITELKNVEKEIFETDKKIIESCKQFGAEVPIFVRR